MPHHKRDVKKEALGSRRTKIKKSGRRFKHLYKHLTGLSPLTAAGHNRATALFDEGRQ